MVILNINQYDLEHIVNYIKWKVIEEQNGIGTFLDNIVISISQHENYKDKNSLAYHLLQRVIHTFEKSTNKRFVSIQERINNLQLSDLDFISRNYSQGVRSCVKWRNDPLFKSVYDLAIYQMLIYELRPLTIIEIGSTKASLNWLKDLTLLFNIESKIIGIDLNKPNEIIDNVEFIQGDIKNISDLLPASYLHELPRPWLIIEDAHVYTLNILNYFSKYLMPGDYLIIEDSINKQTILKTWYKKIQPNHFVVDTYYTDFFGVNSTSAANSIIKRV